MSRNPCGCGKSSHHWSTVQTLSELDFQRGLWMAAINNDVDRIKQLLQQGCDPNIRDSSGYTALHYASRNGSFQVVQLLLEAGADPNCRTNSGCATPLHRAAYMGHSNLIKLLLDFGGDPMAKDSDGNTALHKCVKHDQFDAAEVLLSHSKVNEKDLRMVTNLRGSRAMDCLDPRNGKIHEGWNRLLL